MVLHAIPAKQPITLTPLKFASPVLQIAILARVGQIVQFAPAAIGGTLVPHHVSQN